MSGPLAPPKPADEVIVVLSCLRGEDAPFGPEVLAQFACFADWTDDDARAVCDYLVAVGLLESLSHGWFRIPMSTSDGGR